MPVTFDPSESTALNKQHDSIGYYYMGSGTLQKTAVSKHRLSLHLQIQVMSLLCKGKIQKLCRLLWARAHLRWTHRKWERVLTSLTSHGRHALWAKFTQRPNLYGMRVVHRYTDIHTSRSSFYLNYD